MKQLLLLIFLITGNFLFSQNQYVISFEGTGQNENEINFNEGIFHELRIDTVSNPNNIWQIGAPQKSVFSSAFTAPNAIVTDTINSYPINDTSSFVLKHLSNSGFLMPATAVLGGRYYVDSDTLSDYGKIEFSTNYGATWIDIKDPAYSDFIIGENYTFSGSSNGWKIFNLGLNSLGHILTIPDTMLFRFSFISDGIQTNKDGLMFDSLFVWDCPPLGLQNISGNQLTISISPNPAVNSVNVELEHTFTEINRLVILDNLGRQVQEIAISCKEKTFKLDLSSLTTGIYTVCLRNSEGYLLSSERIIKVE